MVKPLSNEMTEKSTKMDKMGSGGSGGNTKPVPMRLFAAWEVDRTPPNCIPRLCSLTITRLSLLTPLPTDMSSLSLAVKMQSSKRTLRSHEIPVPQQSATNNSITAITTTSSISSTASTITSSAAITNNIQSGITTQGYNSIQHQQQQHQQQQQQQQQLQQQNQQNLHSGITSIGDGNSISIMGNINTHTNATGAGINLNTTSIGGSGGVNIINPTSGQGNISGNNSTSTSTIPAPLLETDLDLHFSLQYPHFIKRDGNRLVILLQRRKKYKSRTILGYKTLAEGVIRMDAVLQKSMDMAVELMATGKSCRPGTTVAILRAERVSSIPVDHDNKNNNSVSLTDRVNEYSDDEEEGEFSSGEDNDDAIDVGLSSYEGGVVGTNNKRDYSTKHEMRKYRKLQRSSNNPEGDGDVDGVGNLGANQGDSDSEFEIKDKGLSRAKISRTISLQQRNFKQKIVALLKRFKATEELDGGVNRGTATLRGERDLDALFQELESLSCGEGDDSGPDLDSLSIGSTPKPSLRPFFTNSRTMLHDNVTTNMTGNIGRRASDKSDNTTVDKKNNSATTPDRNDSSGNEGYTGNTDPEGQNSDPQNTGSPPRDKDIHHHHHQQQQHQQMLQLQQQQTPVTNEKRSRLFRTSSSTPGSGSKKKQSLSLSAEPKSVLETCLSPTNVEPRKLLLDQLSKVFSVDEALLPDVVTIISPPEACGSHLAARLNPIFTQTFRPAFIPQNTAEVKAVLQALMTKIQKYCNSNAKPPTTIKILLLGGDWLQGAALRHYVELLGVRPPDWVHHLRFYIVPIVSSSISRHLSSIDQSYQQMFGTENWHQLCERAANIESNLVKPDILELTNRIQRYLHTAGPCTQIPIAEAMVNYKDEDSCQIFVPFVSDVRIGNPEGPNLSLDLDEANSLLSNSQQPSSLINSGQTISGGNIGINSGPASNNTVISSSPPLSGRNSPPMPMTPALHKDKEFQQLQQSIQQMQSTSGQEPVELQIDYWPIIKPGDVKDKNISKGGDQGKNSIKSSFRNLQVWRLPTNPQIGEISNGLTVTFATKEKKQKIMRLGKKKEKDRDQEKEQCVEGVSRLICSPKQSHPIPLRVYIDGTEWTGVKFFQLSSQWQTHVKNFPVALIGAPIQLSDLT